MITVDSVYRALEKMRSVYPFKDEDTVFHMDRSMCRGEDSVVCIATLDEESGVKVRLEKDAGEEVQNERFR